jgi:D-arabinose 1-dehydrogenase-like Zn-dependent alcohol dehydrogenase
MLRSSKPLDPRFCDKRETAGFANDGAFAEYMVGDPATIVKLPDSVSFEQAAPLMCAGATVWGSLERTTTGIEAGETIAIIGIGGLGHLGIQFAKAMGFRTIAVDARPAGCELARQVENCELLPDLVVNSSNLEEATDAIYNFTNGEGVAAAIVCTDSIPANRWALTLLRIGGSLGVLGLPPQPWQFDANVMVFKELTIRSSYVAGREATERMMQIVELAGVRSQITSVSYEQIPDIIGIYEDKSFRGRIVVHFP